VPQLFRPPVSGGGNLVGDGVDGNWVCADELGAPIHPVRYSDEFARLCRRAGLRRIRLHDCRATMNSILELAGVPDSVRASWLGHSIEVNRQSYLARPGT
jgi:integrase